MNQLSSVLVYGELLVDRFDNGPERRGGAPFNVAWHLRGFGENPTLISRIGKDKDGRQLLKDMADWDMNTGGIQQDDEMPTGFVSVFNQETNPRFEIHKNVAYDFIDSAGIGREILEKEYDFIYHGSLALRNPVSKKTFDYIENKNKHTPVFFDVNLRPPWWSTELIKHYIKRTSRLKCNDAELMMLMPGHDDPDSAARQIIREYSIESLIVTMGDNGAFIRGRDGSFFREDSSETGTVINSVGAGDGFSAVMILGLIRGWPMDLTLKRANAFAAEICQIDGAVPDSKSFYHRLQKDWK